MPQAAELGSILNCARQLMGFTIAFYAIPLAEKVGVQDAWLILAFISVAMYLLTTPLLIWGPSWRREIDWHKDL